VVSHRSPLTNLIRWSPLGHVQVPQSLLQRRAEVVRKLKTLEAQVKPIIEFLSNEDNVKLLKADKGQNMAFLQKEFGIGEQLHPDHLLSADINCCNSFSAAPHSENVKTSDPPRSHLSAPAGPEQVDALYHYAKWEFECGNYSAAAEHLYFFRMLSTHPERTISAQWGKVAADILLQVWLCAVGICFVVLGRVSSSSRSSFRLPWVANNC
jgi:translation initiation factor 3 subunit E